MKIVSFDLEANTKPCTCCKEVKPLIEFHKKGKGRLRSACKECHNKKAMQRYHTRPATREAHRKAAYRYTLKRYGMSIEDKEAMFKEQGGECGICGKEFKNVFDRDTQVDHCHKSEGKGAVIVRGLLCNNCNNMIGKVGDDITLLERGITWLRKKS